MGSPFMDPHGWTRVTIGGVEFQPSAISYSDRAGGPRSLGRTIGRCTITMTIPREDYDRLRSLLLRPFRRWAVCRQLAARSIVRRPRVFS